MRIEQLMSRDVRTCRSKDSLATVTQSMSKCDCGCVPLIDGERLVVGTLTDRDLCMAAWIKGCNLHEIRLADAMSPQVVACRIDEEAEVAEALMREHGVRRLLVIDLAGRLAGVLSLADLACEARRENGRSWREVDSFGVALTLADMCEPRLGARPDDETVLIAKESELTLIPVRRIESVRAVREAAREGAPTR